MALLEMRGIEKRFGGVEALKGVDFTLEAREVHALVGENGAGKSTLMKVLSGALIPDSGAILLEGRPLRLHSVAEAQRQGIVMVYQELNLVPDLTVAENLALGPPDLALSRASAGERVREGLLLRLRRFAGPRRGPRLLPRTRRPHLRFRAVGSGSEGLVDAEDHCPTARVALTNSTIA